MKNPKLESEAIQISVFCHIICQILFLHRELTLVKVLFFSYLLKTKKGYINTLYTANNIKLLDDKITSMLQGDYIGFCESLDFMMKALHILIKNKSCKIENDIVFFLSRKGYEQPLYDENSFFYKAIEFSKDVEDFQFLKEIVQNV